MRRRSILALAIAPFLNAQSPDAGPKFEVAAIKPNESGRPGHFGPELRNGRLTGSNASLKEMVEAAYGLADPLIIAPDWLGKTFFDIAAKSPYGVPDTEIKPMLQALLQALLQERFHLAIHREMRDMPAYNLVVAKGGLKIKPWPAPENPAPPYPRGTPKMMGTFTMSRLADSLSRLTGKPVFDKIGLTGRYNLTLSFAFLSPKTSEPSDAGGPPDLFTAVQEQLGLKLEPTKSSVEVVVVDHIDREPTEN